MGDLEVTGNCRWVYSREELGGASHQQCHLDKSLPMSEHMMRSNTYLHYFVHNVLLVVHSKSMTSMSMTSLHELRWKALLQSLQLIKQKLLSVMRAWSPAFEGLKQKDQEFEASLAFTLNSRIA